MVEDLKEIIDRLDAPYVKMKAKDMNEQDMEFVVKNHEEVMNKVKNVPAMKEYAVDCKWMLALVEDFFGAKYLELPYPVIQIAVFGLRYLLNPVDVIPDIIPKIGHMDDARVIEICMGLCREDIEKYRKWKKKQ